MPKYLKHLNPFPTTYFTGRTDLLSVTAKPGELLMYADIINSNKNSVNYNEDLWTDYLSHGYWTVITSPEVRVNTPVTPVTPPEHTGTSINQTNVLFSATGEFTAAVDPWYFTVINPHGTGPGGSGNALIPHGDPIPISGTIYNPDPLATPPPTVSLTFTNFSGTVVTDTADIITDGTWTFGTRILGIGAGIGTLVLTPAESVTSTPRPSITKYVNIFNF